MSVRAYKIIEIKKEKEPTFNCWHNGHIVDLASNSDNYSDGGFLEFEKSFVEDILSDWRELDKKGDNIDSDVSNKDSIETLEQIILDCGHEDYVEYYCF